MISRRCHLLEAEYVTIICDSFLILHEYFLHVVAYKEQQKLRLPSPFPFRHTRQSIHGKGGHVSSL